MTPLSIFLTIVAFFLIKFISEQWEEWRERKEQSNNIEETENMEKENFGTKELFLETLTKIGCQYVADEEDKERFVFNYQGERFTVDINNESLYVRLWDMFWGSVDTEDIDQISRLRKVINEANIRFGTTTVYSINEEEGKMDVHCKSTFIFTSMIPEIEDYLRAELNGYFHVHRYISTELEKLKNKEEAVRA